MRLRYFVLLLLTLTLLNADVATWDKLSGNTDWTVGSNWSTGVKPGPTDIANFDGAHTVDNSPVLSGSESIDGVDVNNGYNSHTYILGDGSLTLGASGFVVNGYYLDIYPNFIVSTNQTWVLNEGARATYFYLYGGLSGSGHLACETHATAYRGHAYFNYSGDPADVTLTGGLSMYRDVDIKADLRIQYLLGVMSAPTSFSFGTGEIKGDNGLFVAKATADSGGKTPGHIIEITNPLTVAAGGLVLLSDQGSNADNMPNIQFAGDIDLGGLLSAGSAQYGATAPLTGDITIRQSLAARSGLCGRQYSYASRSSQCDGGISDGLGNFGNPLIMRNHNMYLYIKGDAADMTYTGGTIIDQCGSDYNDSNRNANVDVDASSRLGVGDVTILPGGMLNLNAESNIEADKVVTVKSSDVANGVVAVSYDGLPEIEGSGGVLAIDNTFSSDLDMSALGDGDMFLGSRDTGTFSGSSLNPGIGNLYRLGGGFQKKVLTISSSVLTGTAGLQVGCAKQRGGGSVYLASPNDFSGDIDVIGLPAFWREPDILDHGSYLYGKADVNGGSPFGNTNGTISLHCGRLSLNQGVYSATPTITRKEVLSVEGRGRLYMDCGNYENHFKFGSLVRQNRGVLTIDTRRQSLGDKERILFETAPTVVNGMLPPWILSEKNATAADDQHFLTYAPTTGVDFFTNYVADINAVTATDVFGGLGGVLTADRSCYAVRTTSALTGDFTLNITGGGLILDDDAADIGCNIDFGVSEGVVFNNDIPFITGKISGSGGITFSGIDGHVILLNNENDFTGGIYINGGTLYADFDTDAAHGSLGPTSNDIYINGGGLCQHKESGNVGRYLSSERTVTLGTSGAYIAGGGLDGYSTIPLLIHSKITGSGMLMVDMQGRDVLSGQIVISNPENDYTGGTFIYANSDYPAEGKGTALDYQGVLKATEEATLGTGDLMVGAYTTCVLQGNTNVNSEADVQVAMYSTLQIDATAPSFGGLSGSGDARLGTSGTATDLSIGGTDKNSVFYGMIYEITGATACSVTKVGSGIFKLYGAHHYAGATTVEEGAFSLLGSIAGNLVVDAGASLMAVVKEDGTALLGHVGGDIDFNGELTLEIPEGYSVPMGTTMTVLTCDGTVTGNISAEDGYKATIHNGEIQVTRAGGGTLLIIQ